MKWPMSNVWTLVAVLLASQSAAAQNSAKDKNKKALVKDLAALQGTWESVGPRKVGPSHYAARVVKVIKGKKDSLTYYDKSGNVLHAQTADFKLEAADCVRILSFYNLKATHGPNKGRVSFTRIPLSYIYKLKDDKLFEVHGMFTDGRRQAAPAVIIWKRAKK